MRPAPRRLAIILSHPVQYYSPWFRWMTAHTDLRLRVFYLWEAGIKPSLDPQFNRTFAWDTDLVSGYAHEFAPNAARHPGSDHFGGLINPSMPRRIEVWRPNAILLFGYNYATHLGIILWARLRGVPLIFRGDSHFLGRGKPSWRQRIMLGLLYRQFAAFACVGKANRDYFQALGVPSSKLFASPHCVDASHFTVTAERRIAAEKLRASLGLEGRRIVLFAGKLVPAKQPRALLEAFITLAPAGTALVFVGDGGERIALETLAATRPDIPVRFLPFANQSEMPVRYLLADLFALPSQGLYETWGLAINEAMHLGVPCLVSDRVGCQRDLVADGETGWVFPSDQPGALAETLCRALHDLQVDAATIRQRVASRIAGYTYKTASAGLGNAMSAIFNHP